MWLGNSNEDYFPANSCVEKQSGVGCGKQVSLQARQLIRDLLVRDPRKRLGSYGGANDIKSHPFFKNIKWPLVRCMVRLSLVLFGFFSIDDGFVLQYYELEFS